MRLDKKVDIIMEWTQVTVTTESESVEAVSFILNDLGASGVKIEDSKDFANLKPGKYGPHGEITDPDDIPHLKVGAAVTAYYPQSVFVPEILPTIKQRVAKLASFGLNPGTGEVTSSAVSDENWATAWKKYYHPVRVTRHLTVVPSWEEYQPQQRDEQLIYLDPGMAFGTGTHPTTRLMLQALEMVVRGNETLLDVGTGSGVLSIAAKLLGVGNVYAYDVDDVAVRSALENIKLNPIAKSIRITPNDLLKGVTQSADIIVANILAEIIVPLIPQAYERLNVGGHFLCSGIIADKADLIIEKLQKQGFRIQETLKIDDWYGIIAYKPLPDE
ncbi:ribosomal protein L11 methyltransferase [Paucilactobacillus hokkaidonensis]|nr:ribosomal protein L11 methyltransferase [Paucilactobacillus hokkaidonensis]